MGFLTQLLFGGGTNKAADIPTLISNGALVIDVRSADEFSGGHIADAINIPHHQIASLIGKHEPDTSRSIVVYCHSGMRSAAAKKSLEKAGYTHVANGGSLQSMRKLLNND